MNDPYSRLYWSVMTDPKFDTIRDDCRLFGAWTLLLMYADMAYPAPAFIPPTVPKGAVARLVEAKLVEELPSRRYRIKGLERERAKRSQSASDAAAKRWHSDRNATASDARMPSQVEAEAKTSTSTGRDARDPADAYWSLTGRYPAGKTLAWIDDLLSKYGAEASIRAIVKAHTEDDATGTLLGRAQDILRAEARQLDRAEREDEQRRLAEKRAKPRVVEPWRQEFAESIAKQYEALS
jgi:hypothetical protein